MDGFDGARRAVDRVASLQLFLHGCNRFACQSDLFTIGHNGSTKNETNAFVQIHNCKAITNSDASNGFRKAAAHTPHPWHFRMVEKINVQFCKIAFFFLS